MKTLTLFTLGILVYLFSHEARAATPFVAGTGITGSWYSAERDGEGFQIEILDGDRALVTWFTYDDSGRQMWLIGTGLVDGDSINVLNLIVTSGAVFGPDFDPESVVRSTWGSLSFQFLSCNAATVHYAGPEKYGSGNVNLIRLTGLRGAPCDQGRPFSMGLTSFPYVASDAGVNEAFRIINDEADLAVLHQDDGLPWPEALAGDGLAGYPEAWRAEWQSKKDRIPPGHKLMVAISPISFGRDSLAAYDNGTESQAIASLGEPWQSADFAHPDVISAYTNHAINALEFFRPDYLLVGIEVNMLRLNAPGLWASYLQLQQHVYQVLKAAYPSQTVLLSFTGLDMIEGYTDADTIDQRRVFRQVEPYTDLFGLSLYPYLTSILTGPVPEDMFRQLAGISTLPYAITETGYFSEAQDFDFGGGVQVHLEGSLEKQRLWIARVLAEAERRNYRFVVNFVNRDYDALCDQLGCSDFLRIWEASGLVDEDGSAKPALTTWREYLARPLRQ